VEVAAAEVGAEVGAGVVEGALVVNEEVEVGDVAELKVAVPIALRINLRMEQL
jgi:hypothetical protein